MRLTDLPPSSRNLHNDSASHASTPSDEPSPAPAPAAASNGEGDPRTLAIVSCTGPGQSKPSRGRDHFTSPLFRELCTFAERQAGRWFLLSAAHGLVDPDDIIMPMAAVMHRKDAAARQSWSARVIEQLAPHLAGVERILLLANARSREYLLDFLRQDGRTVQIPLEGLSLGEQLQWLRRQQHAPRNTDAPNDL